MHGFGLMKGSHIFARRSPKNPPDDAIFEDFSEVFLNFFLI